MRSSVYFSKEAESYPAGKRAVRAVIDGLAGKTPDLLFLFATAEHDLKQLVAGISTEAAGIPLCGCSGSGVISSAGAIETSHSFVLTGILLEGICCLPFSAEKLGHNSFEAGRNVGRQLLESEYQGAESALIFLFADGCTLVADDFFHGLQNILPRHVDIVGGAAGTIGAGKDSSQFFNGRVLKDSICGVLLYGNFTYHIGVTNGVSPVGSFRSITKTDRNTILEIDDVVALDILQLIHTIEEPEDLNLNLNHYELGQEFPGQGYCENILSRAITGIDRKRGGLILPVKIPQGTKIRLTRREKDLILSRSAEMAGGMFRTQAHPEDSTYFYFDSAGRGSSLFGAPSPDVKAVLNGLAPCRPSFAGLFTLGEFGPINGCNYFHNYTGVLVGILA